jgi:hypothetical protein
MGACGGAKDQTLMDDSLFFFLFFFFLKKKKRYFVKFYKIQEKNLTEG